MMDAIISTNPGRSATYDDELIRGFVVQVQHFCPTFLFPMVFPSLMITAQN